MIVKYQSLILNCLNSSDMVFKIYFNNKFYWIIYKHLNVHICYFITNIKKAQSEVSNIMILNNTDVSNIINK